ILMPREGRYVLGVLDDVAVPPVLRQVIDARIGSLDDESQHLLAVAAVIGQTVSLETWATVAEADEGAVAALAERAEEAGILISTTRPDAAAFAHALIRESLYASLPGVRRGRIHRRVAATLVAARSPDPDMVAFHFQRAGDAGA